MKTSKVTVWAGVLIVGMLLTIGCSSYPTKFGVLHGGHANREHAKPMEGGYYSDFDPQAAQLEVIPVEATNPVRTQHILVATVKDKEGKPLTGRRVEWLLAEGSVGTIVEVDESGWYNTRGHKVDNKYAFSHTNHGDHVLTRGNNDASDDVHLKKGQTWCVITSPIEGSSHVVVYAPGIFNWDKHKVFVTKNWNDATWKWPENATNPIGTKHTFEVLVMRYSDSTPIPGAIVNFKITGGPAGHFLPDKKQIVAVKTDPAGMAKVTLEQAKPKEGTNTVAMEIILQPCGECKPPMRLASGTVTKTWVGPRISIKKSAPAQASVNEAFRYQIVVTNPGKAAATNVQVTDALPDGIKYASSQPSAKVNGQNLAWSLGTLKPNESRSLSVTVSGTRTGKFKNCANVAADHGLKAESCAPTIITSPKLSLTKSGPAEVLICEPITYTVVVKNNGDGPATNVQVDDKLPVGLVTLEGRNSILAKAGTLQPGQSKQFVYKVKAQKRGTYENTATATGDKGLKAAASHKVVVREPVLVLTKTGPKKRFVNRTATYQITVSNKGDGAARSTVVTDTLPAGLTFVSATNGGKFANGRITWNLGTLLPNGSKQISVTARATRIGNVRNVVRAEAQCTVATAETSTAIAGIPAILLEVIDLEDPIEVGSNETYVIVVTNQGSAPGTNIKVICTLPDEQTYVSSTGPSKASVAGKKVTFAPLATLAPKAKATYRLIVKGTKPGDVRFTVEMISDQMTSSVMETESTNQYE
jgi:uncharacterized repeat protein (TIGR01451 family)